MTINSSSRSVVCFGEILWDNLPGGRNPGGAPMNVAYHLHKLGIGTAVISAVGDDRAGTDLIGFLRDSGVSTECIQVDALHQTSEVVATVNDDHEVSYDILVNVAWDYIQANEFNKEAVKKADAFVFGSLIARSRESRRTLFTLLECAAYRVFDVNLRSPHYSPELIAELMHHADLLKVNAAELQLIANWNNCETDTEAEIVANLFKQYPLKEIVITKGSAGAGYYTPLDGFNRNGWKVTVQDTIGSGDSFLAALLAMKLNGEANEEALDCAVAMGGFITSKEGACPDYDKEEFERFMQENR